MEPGRLGCTLNLKRPQKSEHHFLKTLDTNFEPKSKICIQTRTASVDTTLLLDSKFDDKIAMMIMT